MANMLISRLVPAVALFVFAFALTSIAGYSQASTSDNGSLHAAHQTCCSATHSRPASRDLPPISGEEREVEEDKEEESEDYLDHSLSIDFAVLDWLVEHRIQSEHQIDAIDLPNSLLYLRLQVLRI